jgi:type IV pilus assembly protein PilY1
VRDYVIKKLSVIRLIGFGVFLLSLAPIAVHAIDISDVPLETAIVTAPPIVMFVFDNSGSMDMEFMTDEFQGLYEGAYYLFPDDAYSPGPDHTYGNGHALSVSDRRKWRSQWAGYNHIYYSPEWRYPPWPATGKYAFGRADLNRPVSDPTQDDGGGVRCRMASLFFSFRSGIDTIGVTNAHYFTHHDTDSDGHWDSGESMYLVTWADNNRDGYVDLGETMGSDQRRYFRLADDGDGVIEDDELIPVVDEAEKNLIRPAKINPSGGFQGYLTDKEELQNFVNWFTYYRRRGFVAKAATARVLAGSGRINAGLYAVNAGPRVSARPIEGLSPDAADAPIGGAAGDLINALYAMASNGGTPLRHALDQVGRYLHQDYPSELGKSPFFTDAGGGSCQRACAVVISDGFWNGIFSGVGNADGDSGKPYADAWGDTLADIAMTYYETDLGPNLPDEVPPTRCDPASHQHMNTYIVSLGYSNHPAANDNFAGDQPPTPCMSDDPSIDIDWPRPSGVMGVEGDGSMRGHLFPQRGNPVAGALEDLRHAAMNGRGRYVNAYSPQVLMRALPEIVAEMNEPACAADVAVDGMGVTDDSKFFQVTYHTRTGAVRYRPFR